MPAELCAGAPACDQVWVTASQDNSLLELSALMAPLLPRERPGPSWPGLLHPWQGICMPLDHTKDLQRPKSHFRMPNVGERSGNRLAASQPASRPAAGSPSTMPWTPSPGWTLLSCRAVSSSPWTSGLEPFPALSPGRLGHQPPTPRQILSPPPKSTHRRQSGK